MNLLDRYRRPVDDTDVTGTPFRADNRNFLARALMPAPAPARMPVAPQEPWRRVIRPSDNDLAADEMWARTDGSPWKRPELLTRALDLYADATSTTRGQITDFVLSNFLGPAAARIPKPVMAPSGMGGGGAPRGGIRAYHGSPHSFDKFDSSKIGTGEGAQAYGRGLYFAEAEDVAKGYRKRLSSADGGVDQIAQTLAAQSGGWDQARRKFEADALSRVQKARDAGLNYDLPDYDVQILKRLREGEPGSMYEVRINADPDAMLDWDKPLSQQSEAVKRAIEPALQKAADDLGKGASPEKIAQFEAMGLGNIAARMRPKNIDPWSIETTTLAREYPTALREAGIPGIRYKDAGSRGTDSGTSNYVVFDDSLIEILRKYGLAGLMAGAGAAGAASEPEPTQ